MKPDHLCNPKDESSSSDEADQNKIEITVLHKDGHSKTLEVGHWTDKDWDTHFGDLKDNRTFIYSNDPRTISILKRLITRPQDHRAEKGV